MEGNKRSYLGLFLAGDCAEKSVLATFLGGGSSLSTEETASDGVRDNARPDSTRAVKSSRRFSSSATRVILGAFLLRGGAGVCAEHDLLSRWHL